MRENKVDREDKGVSGVVAYFCYFKIWEMEMGD